jgi:N-acyl amino acid synthase of PEP-CTERM/exosortase system
VPLAFALHEAVNSKVNSTGFASSYASHFELVRADTPALLDEAYRLRFQVYCVENPFEDTNEHSAGYERDADDDRSAHILLKHRSSNSFAGTVRVILPSRTGAFLPLPIQQILASQGHNPCRLPLSEHMAEISRFAISKDFRRRLGEEKYPDVPSADALLMSEERRLVPYITFGLIRGVLEICAEHEIAHVGAVMEPALIRILRRFGLNFQHFGNLVEHHGMRQPCVARLRDLIDHSRSSAPLLWQYVRHDALPKNRQTLLAA